MAKSKYWNGTSWEVLGTDASKVVEETDKRFMTDAEKTKLAGIEANADVSVIRKISNFVEFKAFLEDTSATIKYGIPTNAISITGNENINIAGANYFEGALTFSVGGNYTLTLSNGDYSTFFAKEGISITGGASTKNLTLSLNSTEFNLIQILISSLSLVKINLTITSSYGDDFIAYEKLSTSFSSIVDSQTTLLQNNTVTSGFIEATTSIKGLMSATDKTKLDTLKPILVKQGTSYSTSELEEGQIGFLYT